MPLVVMTLSPTFSDVLEFLNLLLPLLHRQQDQEIEDTENDGERQELEQPGGLQRTGHRETRSSNAGVHSVLGSAGKGLMELQRGVFQTCRTLKPP